MVVRKDLGMRAGKAAAQISHASMAFMAHEIRAVLEDNSCGSFDCCGSPRSLDFTPEQLKWITGDKFTKIVARVNSEAELLEIEAKALEAGLEVNLITDSGLTEFKGVPTRTCLAIGPDWASKIDPITGHLELL